MAITLFHILRIFAAISEHVFSTIRYHKNSQLRHMMVRIMDRERPRVGVFRHFHAFKGIIKAPWLVGVTSDREQCDLSLAVSVTPDRETARSQFMANLSDYVFPEQHGSGGRNA